MTGRLRRLAMAATSTSERRFLGLAATIAVVCLVALAVLPDDEGESSADAAPAGNTRIERWVDGDTVIVWDDYTYAATRVRLVGIDTPETQTYGGANECVDRGLADAATAAAETMAPAGAIVQLDGDEVDPYGRRLATVTAMSGPADEPVDVGAALVAAGLARAWPDGACPVAQ